MERFYEKTSRIAQVYLADCTRRGHHSAWNASVLPHVACCAFGYAGVIPGDSAGRKGNRS